MIQPTRPTFLQSTAGPGRIGCGLVRIGWKYIYKGQKVATESEAQNFLLHAVNSGVKFFDTAPAYGYSEQRLGRFLLEHPELRQQMTIASKCGQNFDFDKMDVFPHDYSLDAIRRSVENSLTLLGQPIDLMQIHSVTPNLLEEELGSGTGIIEMLRKLQAGGNIRHLGITFSRWNDAQRDQLAQVLRSGIFSTIQVPYHLNDISLLWAIEMAANCGIGVISNRVIASGALSDRIEEAVSFVLANRYINLALVGTANNDNLDRILEAAKR